MVFRRPEHQPAFASSAGCSMKATFSRWPSSIRTPPIFIISIHQDSAPMKSQPMAARMQSSRPNDDRLPIDAPERRRLPLLLRRAWYGLNQAFRRRIAHLGLTPDQFTVMRTLLENEGISQRKLTTLMSSDANTVASLLNRMEKAGLLQRQTHEKDRRANRLRLKSSAKEKYEIARGIAVQLQTEILSAIPQ